MSARSPFSGMVFDQGMSPQDYPAVPFFFPTITESDKQRINAARLSLRHVPTCSDTRRIARWVADLLADDQAGLAAWASEVYGAQRAPSITAAVDQCTAPLVHYAEGRAFDNTPVLRDCGEVEEARPGELAYEATCAVLDATNNRRGLHAMTGDQVLNWLSRVNHTFCDLLICVGIAQGIGAIPLVLGMERAAALWDRSVS